MPNIVGCVKVVKIGEESKVTGNTSASSNNSIESEWDSKIIPELSNKAVDLKTLLSEANGDLKSVANKYGKQAAATSGDICYTVKGVAKVDKINTDLKVGYMEVSLDGYSGPIKIKIQVGPVYKGTAVRDSLDFIKYDDYENQIEWAAVSQSIHETIQKKVIGSLDLSALSGKTIEFLGCFSVSGSNQSEILITPVKLSVK